MNFYYYSKYNGKSTIEQLRRVTIFFPPRHFILSNPIGKETAAPNPTGNIKKRAKQNAPKIPTQEEFKEFFKEQGQEKLANGFYEYCTNEKGWENITNWRAYAKKYIKEPYDLTKTKKPKATKKNHKPNGKPTQEEFKALRLELEKMANEPIAPLKRT